MNVDFCAVLLYQLFGSQNKLQEIYNSIYLLVEFYSVVQRLITNHLQKLLNKQLEAPKTRFANLN